MIPEIEPRGIAAERSEGQEGYHLNAACSHLWGKKLEAALGSKRVH